jgi:hypothetical protein
MIHGWTYLAHTHFLATSDFANIPVNSYWPCEYRTEVWNYLCLRSGGDKSLYAVITPTGELMGFTRQRSKPHDPLPDGNKPHIFVPKDVPDSKAHLFDRQLIYSGKQGSIIKISYREFSSNMARPSFYQDLTYDLSESKEITFQNV